MKIQRNFVKNQFGEKLETVIKYDGKKSKYPAILFVSGFGQDYHEYANSFDEIAETLVKKGFLTIQFSFAGCGKSDGDYREMTLRRQAAQIKDVLKFVKKNPKVDSEKIGLVAQSFGVPTTILTLPIPVKSMIFVSGAVKPYESIREVFIERDSFNPAGISTLPRSDGKFTSIGPEFWQDLKQYKSFPSLLKAHSNSLLIIHGAQDTKVSTKNVKKLFAAAKGSKKLKIFKGGDHGIDEVPKAVRQEFLQDIVNWFKKTL